MTEAFEDVSSLPGSKVLDQEDIPIGEVKEIYSMEDGYPMWVSVELSTGIGGQRPVLIPIARLKEEDGKLRVPYSKSHVGEAPEVDAGDGISPECDQALRAYYGIDVGDLELRTDNKSYAARVPEESGPASPVEDPSELETPDADTRTDETFDRLKDPGSAEMRHVTFEGSGGPENSPDDT